MNGLFRMICAIGSALKCFKEYLILGSPFSYFCGNRNYRSAETLQLKIYLRYARPIGWDLITSKLMSLVKGHIEVFKSHALRPARLLFNRKQIMLIMYI